MMPLTPEGSRLRGPRRLPRVARKMGQPRVTHSWHAFCLVPVNAQQARQFSYNLFGTPESSTPG